MLSLLGWISLGKNIFCWMYHGTLITFGVVQGSRNNFQIKIVIFVTFVAGDAYRIRRITDPLKTFILEALKLF